MIIKEDFEEDKDRVIEAAEEAGLSYYEEAMAVAALEYFDCDVDEVLEGIENGEIKVSEYNPNLVEFNSVEALIFDDYEEAKAAAIEDTKELFNDIGIEGFNVDLADFADDDWFKDALIKSFEFYCHDITNEDDDIYGNRLVQECYDRELITDSDFEEDVDGNIDYTRCTVDEDELVERYAEWYENDLWSTYNGNFVKAYVDDFGEEQLNYIIKYNPDAIDVDALAEYCVNQDGAANSLAGYDGEEHEVVINNWSYLVYRTN